MNDVARKREFEEAVSRKRMAVAKKIAVSRDTYDTQLADTEARAKEILERKMASITPEIPDTPPVPVAEEKQTIQLDEATRLKIELLASKRYAAQVEEQLLVAKIQALRQLRQQLGIAETSLLDQIGKLHGYTQVSSVRLVDASTGACIIEGIKIIPTTDP